MALTETSFVPKWKSGKTTVIRVPEALVDDILRVARQLDNGDLPCNTESKGVSPSKIILEAIDQFLEQRRQEWGTNNAQHGEFNPHSVRYAMLQEFRHRVAEGVIIVNHESDSRP